MPDNSRVNIRQKRKGDILIFGKFPQRFLIIIRNSVDINVVGRKFVERIAQLTELRPAGGSPYCRAIKNHYRFPSNFIVDALARGIWKAEIWQPLADGRPGRMVCRKACSGWMAKRSWSIKAVMVSFYKHVHTLHIWGGHVRNSNIKSR